MHQDKLVARILLIFSVTNIVLAAPVVVRQRHLDVARAAPQKRGPISDNEETGDSPPESSSPMPPHDGLTNGGAESSSAAANHHVSWAPGLDNEETDDLPPEPSSRMPMHNGLTNGWAESSSMATNHITTQVSGAPGLDNGETGDLPHVPPHTSPTDEWAWLEGVEQVSSPEWSSEASDRITTQAPEEPGLGNGAMGNLLPESSSPIPPHDSLTNGWLDHTPLPESSSAAANHITTQASGDTASSSSDSAHLGGLPAPHQGSAPEVSRLFTGLTHKILLYSGVAAVIGGTAALAYGIHKWTKHPYVSPLSPADM